MTKLINTQNGQVETKLDFMARFPNCSFGHPLDYSAFDRAEIIDSPQPAYDPITQTVREALPIRNASGQHEQVWEVVELDAETIAANRATKEAADTAAIAAKIDSLWRAADQYISDYISGVAIGLLTIGVLQQKPKALAVTAWTQAVWAEYYVRKTGVTATSDLNLDYSGFGAMPYSVPELQAEIGL